MGGAQARFFRDPGRRGRSSSGFHDEEELIALMLFHMRSVLLSSPLAASTSVISDAKLLSRYSSVMAILEVWLGGFFLDTGMRSRK
jgi:hypothetical protein